MAKRIIVVLALFLTACGADSGTEPASVSLDCTETPRHLPSAPVPDIQGYKGTWVKNPEQVIPVSTGPEWFDTGYTAAQIVLRDGDRYLTYYTGGMTETQPGRESFGVAFSVTPDGPRTKYYGNGLRGSLFELGEFGRFDHDRAWGMGSVIYEDGIYKTWYVGDSEPGDGHIARAGYATSLDGLSWTKHYANTETGAIFEDMTGCHPTYPMKGLWRFPVIHDTDGYYAFYPVFNSDAVRLAYSEDGFNNWRILGNINLPEPVMGVGNILKDGDVYYLTTTRTDFLGVTVFVSKDKVNWTKYDELLISPEYEWQQSWMAYPYLFKDGDRWYLYYMASHPWDDGFNGRIGVAVLQ